MFWIFLTLGILLGVVGLTYGGAFVYGSVQPRIKAKKNRLKIEEKKAEARQLEEERLEALDIAIKNLARHDVFNPETETIKDNQGYGILRERKADIHYFYEKASRSGYHAKLTAYDMTYVNEKYPGYVKEATTERLGNLKLIADLEAFEFTRAKHKDTVRRVAEAHQESLEQANKDPYKSEFAMLTGNKNKEWEEK